MSIVPVASKPRVLSFICAINAANTGIDYTARLYSDTTTGRQYLDIGGAVDFDGTVDSINADGITAFTTLLETAGYAVLS